MTSGTLALDTPALHDPALLPIPLLLPVPTDEDLPRPCSSCPLVLQLTQARQQAHYYRAMHQRALQREAALKDRTAQLEAQNRDLRQRHFGKKSENRHASDPSANPDPGTDAAGPKRRRGQQKGQPGHGRRNHDHLPAQEETLDLPPDQRRCSCCGLPFESFPGTDDTTILEIDVRAHRRVVRRPRHRPTCSCAAQPGIVTAPPPPRLIPKSPFGISIWVTVLLDKYLSYRPTARLLDDLRSHGLDLSQGALTGGLQHLLPLFQPLYEALCERSRQDDFWHADETRWLVFAEVQGKVGHRWYLWAVQSAEVVVFLLAMGRSHEVPEKHFGAAEDGILVVDRYKAYQAMEQVKTGKIVLAFCWAHQRRDFVEVGRNWPTETAWAEEWLVRIGELFHLNRLRLEVREDSEAFAQRDADLRVAVAAVEAQAQAELAVLDLHPARQKALASLRQHWAGLTVFVEHPEVPMDNNAVERTQRGPVVGRKNYYGSGAVWSGQLAALLFSLFQTLRLWGLNPRLWLTAYLTACAEAGGRVPATWSQYLPWNLSEEQRAAWSLPERGSGGGGGGGPDTS